MRRPMKRQRQTSYRNSGSDQSIQIGPRLFVVADAHAGEGWITALGILHRANSHAAVGKRRKE
jgi:hypothetical protein